MVSLDLSDYLHITDFGISCVAGMTSLTSLSLSRTKLTDAGMPFLEGILPKNDQATNKKSPSSLQVSKVLHTGRSEFCNFRGMVCGGCGQLSLSGCHGSAG